MVTGKTSPWIRRNPLLPWAGEGCLPGTVRRLEQCSSTLSNPRLSVTRNPSVPSLPIYSLNHRPELAQATGKQQSPSTAEASLGAEFSGFCRGPQLSASEYWTQIRRWPEGSPHTCQGYVAGPLVPIRKDFQSSVPFLWAPTKQSERRRRNYCQRSQNYPAEVLLLQAFRCEYEWKTLSSEQSTASFLVGSGQLKSIPSPGTTALPPKPGKLFSSSQPYLFLVQLNTEIDRECSVHWFQQGIRWG